MVEWYSTVCSPSELQCNKMNLLLSTEGVGYFGGSRPTRRSANVFFCTVEYGDTKIRQYVRKIFERSACALLCPEFLLHPSGQITLF